MNIKDTISKFIKSHLVKILYCCAILLLFIFVVIYSKNNETSEKQEDISEEIVEKENKEDFFNLKEQFNKYKEINEDYIGQIYFESGLLNLPFVQGKTNDTYLRTDFETMEYSVAGSVFMDCGNKIQEDQNIILYGHNYTPEQDPSLSKMFAPLRALKEKDNYDDNKIVCLFLGDKTLKYQIVSVYIAKIVEEDGVQYIAEDEPIYVIRNYKRDELKDYIEKFKSREYYDSGLSIEDNDKLLTLQTCVDNSVDKLIVLSKLIDVIEE